MPDQDSVPDQDGTPDHDDTEKSARRPFTTWLVVLVGSFIAVTLTAIVIERRSPTNEPASVPSPSDQLTGAGAGTASEISTDGADLVTGEPKFTVTDEDFVIETTMKSCTTVVWSVRGPGLERVYDSGDECFDAHVMSPRTDVDLRPATSYDVVINFADGAATQTLVFVVTTAA